MKYLLLLLLIAVAIWLVKTHAKRSRHAAETRRTENGEDMVRCAQCGLHLPRSESLSSGRAFYCSAEHRRLRENTH